LRTFSCLNNAILISTMSNLNVKIILFKICGILLKIITNNEGRICKIIAKRSLWYMARYVNMKYPESDQNQKPAPRYLQFKFGH